MATSEGLGIIAAPASRLWKKKNNLISNVASSFLLFLLSYLHLSIALDDFVIAGFHILYRTTTECVVLPVGPAMTNHRSYSPLETPSQGVGQAIVVNNKT